MQDCDNHDRDKRRSSKTPSFERHLLEEVFRCETGHHKLLQEPATLPGMSPESNAAYGRATILEKTATKT